MVEILCKIWRLQVLSQELEKPMGLKQLELLTLFKKIKYFNSTEYSNTHNKDNYTFPCLKILSNPHMRHLAFQKRHQPGWSLTKAWSTASFPFSPPSPPSQYFSRLQKDARGNTLILLLYQKSQISFELREHWAHVLLTVVLTSFTVLQVSKLIQAWQRNFELYLRNLSAFKGTY